MSSSLSAVLTTLALDRVTANSFTGEQLPAPDHHILGGHISAQSLLAAGRTAPGRGVHSVHTYFLRPGDARRAVDFEVVELQEGRTFSARRVTARQDGQVLLEAMASFKLPADPSAAPVEYQPPLPAVPEPESLPAKAPPAASNRGRLTSLSWFERRLVDEDRLPPARSRMWWRPDGEVPDEPELAAALVAYLSAVTLTEPAFAARGGLVPSAQRDHSVWFHQPPVLSDWLLYDRASPSSANALAVASGKMFNRNGDLVCTVTQEMYFPPPR